MITRLAPLAARLVQVAAPMPLEPPVTMASLPSRIRVDMVEVSVGVGLRASDYVQWMWCRRRSFTTALDFICGHSRTLGGLEGWVI